ncbi:MAG: VCBS repeat-containing protein [Phycisphaerales bacterium]
MPLKTVPIVMLAVASLPVAAQTFPIVPIADPIYPADITELTDFEWVDRLGTLTRIGDLNNDGIDDLLVLFLGPGSLRPHETKTLWLYTRNADGTLNAPEFIDGFSLEAHTQIDDLLIHDHNHDGVKDIVFLADAGQHLIACVDKNGSFVPLPALALPNSDGTASFAQMSLLDLNDDGLQDYCIKTSEGRFDAWLTAGSNEYEPLEIGVIPHLGTSVSFESDVDADGDDDLITIASRTVWLSENTGASYLPPQEVEPEITNLSMNDRIPFAADANGDGQTDIVYIAQSPQGVALGTYLAPFDFDAPREAHLVPLTDFGDTHAEAIVGEGHLSVRYRSDGDIDGDGTDDLLVLPIEDTPTAWLITDPMDLHERHTISEVFFVYGDGAFDPLSPIPQQRDIPLGRAFLDVNGDGVRDLIQSTTARRYIDLGMEVPDPNGVMVWATLSNPFDKEYLKDPRDSITVISSNLTHIMHADADGDGDPEIFFSRDDLIKLIDRNQEGYWEHQPRTRFIAPFTGWRTLPADFDGNGGLDLISLANQSSAYFPAVFLDVEVGDGGITRNPGLEVDPKILDDTFDTSFNSGSASFAIADIDSDGDTDILLRCQSDYFSDDDRDTVLPWINGGNGDFLPGTPVQITGCPFPAIQILDTLDHDQDGDPDLVSIAGDEASTWIEIYANDGSGIFSLQHQIPIHNHEEVHPYWLNTADLDNDGYTDIQLLCNDQALNSEIVVLYGSAGGISTTPVYLPGPAANEVIVRDIDNNGLPDLITSSSYSTGYRTNSLTIAYQTAPRVFAPLVSLFDAQLSSLDVLDISSDGVPDIVGTQAPGNRIPYYRGVPQVCPADLNLDGRINFFDIASFIQLFAGERPLADLNRDGVHNFFDFSAMLEAYRNGCS